VLLVTLVHACGCKSGLQAVLWQNKAIALYKGPFLGKQDDFLWALPVRERLRAKFLRHVVQWGQSLVQAGDYQAAILVYQKGLEIDALAEEFYCNLMRCYLALDRRAETVGVYERCRKTLGALGISPSSETSALYKPPRGKRLDAAFHRPPGRCVIFPLSPAAFLRRRGNQYPIRTTSPAKVVPNARGRREVRAIDLRRQARSDDRLTGIDALHRFCPAWNGP